MRIRHWRNESSSSMKMWLGGPRNELGITSGKKGPQGTFYDIMSRYEKELRIIYRKPSGRPVSKSTPEVARKVMRLFNKNPFISTRTAASKLKITPKTLNRIKVHRRYWL